jgi:hypothetical protein
MKKIITVIFFVFFYNFATIAQDIDCLTLPSIGNSTLIERKNIPRIITRHLKKEYNVSTKLKKKYYHCNYIVNCFRHNDIWMLKICVLLGRYKMNAYHYTFVCKLKDGELTIICDERYTPE